MYFRAEVDRTESKDAVAAALERALALASPELSRQIKSSRVSEVYWVRGMPSVTSEQVESALISVLGDPVLRRVRFKGAGAGGLPPGNVYVIEKSFLPGVTDNVGRTLAEASSIVLSTDGIRAASGALWVIESVEPMNEADLKKIAREAFYNPMVERARIWTGAEFGTSARFENQGTWEETLFPKAAGPKSGPARIEHITLQGLDATALVELSRSRLWALSSEEMQALQTHFGELGRNPTDVECEVIAQSWSEHCKHKIFGAEIAYREEIPAGGDAGILDESLREEMKAGVKSLFKTTVAGTTAKLKRPWLLSVFDDNAGVVDFDETDAVCIKVETHNSPSALDPFGGALTGIVGVNRDILGTGLGARPIFNTDVFCVADPDYAKPLPDKLLHPRRILGGIRRGVEHGGNQSGIPNVGGALYFDERYLGKPLVYCGTGGILPKKVGPTGELGYGKEVKPGDRIVMVGGRIGKDGIHGATFSSLALDDDVPMSVVQLGDPITQKRMADFLLEARDLGLYRAITDNGAGGLSSSVGEMAQFSNGATMDVGLAPTKYPGLLPYELTVSESQERMTCAVDPVKLPEFLELASRRGVEATDLGQFQSHGKFEVLYLGEKVADLSLKFLHEGTPRMKLTALWKGVPAATPPKSKPADFMEESPRVLKALLARNNIASKEWLVRQYDHEVQGSSVVKPLNLPVMNDRATRASSPNDGAMIRPKLGSPYGLVVASGIQSRLSDLDAALMAEAGVDEAVRNALAVGAEFGRDDVVFALIDNFCWPDPVSNPERAADLVRACFGMREAALKLGLPFISGKDSMKNDFKGQCEGKPVQISVPPTLLITAMARVTDLTRARTSFAKTAGDVVVRLGPEAAGLRGSEFEAWSGDHPGERARFQSQLTHYGRPNWDEALKVYRFLGGKTEERAALKSIHDLSEGGLFCAAAEMIFGTNLGIEFEIPTWSFETAFGEGFHRFLITVSSADYDRLATAWTNAGISFEKLGLVTARGELAWSSGGKRVAMPVAELEKAWLKVGHFE